MDQQRLKAWWERRPQWLRAFALSLVIIFVALVVMRVQPQDALRGAAALSVGYGVATWITDKFRARLRP